MAAAVASDELADSVVSYRWRARYRLATPSAATTASATVSPMSARRSERAIERRCTENTRGSYNMARMTLGRVWRGQLLGAVGAAVTVPVALVGAIAVLALAGGFGGLSSLGQAFSGPSIPASQPASDRAQATARPVPAALAAALSTTGARTAASAAGAASPSGAASSAPTHSTSSSGGRSGGSPSTTTSPGGSGNPSPGSGTRPHRTPGPGPASGTAPQPKPQPNPQPNPTVADRVVAAGTSVSSQIPGPAGPAATSALQSAGSTLDSIAPIKSP